MIRLAALLLALSMGGAAAAESELRITAAHWPEGFFTRLCQPEQPGPARLVVINHGATADPAARHGSRPAACTSEAVRWFTARGYAVALPLRRGYGETGGPWAESFGRCAEPEYRAAGLETARDMLAVVRGLLGQPGIADSPAILVGQSAAGWGGLALAAENPAEIAILVNMAGGRGGWQGGRPNQVCRDDQLVAAAGAFGRSARQPGLWIYAANDSFFDHALARRLLAAWSAGGAPAEFHPVPAFGHDGHGLLFMPGGSGVWGPLVEDFLARQAR